MVIALALKKIQMHGIHKSLIKKRKGSLINSPGMTQELETATMEEMDASIGVAVFDENDDCIHN